MKDGEILALQRVKSEINSCLGCDMPAAGRGNGPCVLSPVDRDQSDACKVECGNSFIWKIIAGSE